MIAKSYAKIQKAVPYSENGPYYVRDETNWNHIEIWRCKTLKDARKVAVLYLADETVPNKTMLYLDKDTDTSFSSPQYVVLKRVVPLNGKMKQFAIYGVFVKNKRKGNWHVLVPITGELGPIIEEV